MTSTSYRYDDFLERKDRAVLHGYKKGRFLPLGQRDADQQAPAGGVSSNVIDLAKWLQLLLAYGQHNGKQLISPEALIPALPPDSFNGREPEVRVRVWGKRG